MVDSLSQWMTINPYMKFNGVTPLIKANLGINRFENPYVSLERKGNDIFRIVRSSQMLLPDETSFHYLLFGQTSDNVIPYPWILASWEYIEAFRCSFGFHVSDALFYPMITIVGTPDLPIPVTKEDEQLIRDSLDLLEGFQLERLWVNSPLELSTLLHQRVVENRRFEGGDVGYFVQ